MTARRGLVTAALALALVPLAPAHAAGSRFLGDCGWDTYAHEEVTGGENEFVGVVYGTVLLFGSGHRNVVNGTLTCEMRLNGVVRASSSRWGSGVVALADTLTFVARETDVFEFCTTVDFTSDDTPTETRCEPATETKIPPQQWIDLLNSVFDVVFDPPVATGGGYNTGDAGFLLLTPPGDPRAAAACAYATDHATGTIAVAGAATAGDVRCVLTDTATGTVLYDDTAPVQHATIPAHDGPVTVCTAGPGVGPHCRPGEPLGDRS